MDDVVDRLGELLSTHPVDNRYHLATGTAIAFGAVLTVELGITVVALGFVLAFVPLARVLRGGVRERFDVHENGLVHHRRSGRRSWTWGEVAALRVRWDPRRRTLSRCVVRFSGGGRLVIHSGAVDGPLLAGTLLARCPEAVAVRRSRGG
ncbi:hypothetical protein [Allokutzneria sp. NRRL B-24872]|uniref:hypothetical protein n=1 Tax=Allokutzneria sp. NRRL B-24872 TaxID=1137961 RepID=UPI000A3955D8|nr:hypothetical protein [Allokutzneria sp. NRRL B-24872]